MDTALFLRKLGDYGADTEKALERFVGDGELYAECFDLFVNDENFPLLAQSIADKDYDKAFSCTHTLKGVAANLGLAPVLEPLSVLVESLRAHQFENVTKEYEQVLEQYEVLVQLLSSLA